jgi:hypothetical protein
MAAASRPALPGQWIAAAARRLFSPEAFSLLIEPAIADLQFERSGRLAVRLEAYATVWIGVVAACDEGLVRRVRTFRNEHELATITGLALLHALHSTWMLVLLLGLDGRVKLSQVAREVFASTGAPWIITVLSVVGLYVVSVLVTRIWTGGQLLRASIVARPTE